MPIANAAKPELLDIVALLNARDGLARGQVGTVVETLSNDAMLVEFGDDNGAAFALLPCPPSELIVLHYARQPA